MTDQFEFEDDGRVFVCSAEQLSKSNPEVWWWFRVSEEAHIRYAPFRASRSDTQRSVQANVVEYYNTMLARRAEPATPHGQRWQRGGGRTEAQKTTSPSAEAK